MCYSTPGAPGCSFPTRPCTSFFGMTNRWWPYLAWFLGTYGRYPAGGWHPPWYFMMVPTDWHPAAAVAPLPIHFLGTDAFINGLLHASFSAMWRSLVPGIWTLYGSMYFACAASGESGLLTCLQLLSSTPQKACATQSAPIFSSCSLIFSNPACTASKPRFCGAFILKNIFQEQGISR